MLPIVDGRRTRWATRTMLTPRKVLKKIAMSENRLRMAESYLCSPRETHPPVGARRRDHPGGRGTNRDRRLRLRQRQRQHATCDDQLRRQDLDEGAVVDGHPARRLHLWKDERRVERQSA